MKQAVYRLIILLLVCASLVSCTGTTSSSDTTAASPSDSTIAPVTEEPEETYDIYEETIGSVRIQLYSQTLLRIEESDRSGEFCDETTLAVTNRTDWPGVKVERTEQDGKIILTTPAYTIFIPSDAKNCNKIYVQNASGDTVWKVNKSSNAITSLPAPAETPDAWAFSDSPRVTVPENGYTKVIDEPDNGFNYTATVKDNYIFVCNGDPFTLRNDYNRLVGSCDMVTVKALGLWFSRYYAYKDTQLLKLVDTFRTRGYPIDYVVCDTDWKMGGSTGYEINTKYFPDMEGFLDQMHEKISPLHLTTMSESIQDRS